MPKLTDSYKEILKSIDALSGAGLGTSQSFADMAKAWEGKYTIDKANELRNWITQNYAAPENIATLEQAKNKYFQPDDELGGDWLNQRRGFQASNAAWRASDDYKAWEAAKSDYNKSQAGRENMAYGTLLKALDSEATGERGRKMEGGWLEKRADDFIENVWDQYNPQISAAILAMISGGVGSGVAAAAGGGALGGAAGGAAAGATTAHLTGGSFGDAMLGGGLLGGAAGYLSSGNPAASLGIENKTGQGAVNGAIKSGLSTAVKGGNVGEGLLRGAIGGGVNGFNPAEVLGIDNKYSQSLTNNALTGFLQGRDKDAILSGATQGALSGALSGRFGSLDDAKAWATKNLLPGAAGDGGGGDEGSNQEGGSGMDDEDIFKWINDNFGEGASSVSNDNAPSFWDIFSGTAPAPANYNLFGGAANGQLQIPGQSFSDILSGSGNWWSDANGQGGGDSDGFVFDPQLIEDTLNGVNQSNAAWVEQNPWWSSLSEDDKALWDNIQAGGFPIVAGQEATWLDKVGNWLNSSSGIGKNGTMGGALATLLGTGLGAASGGGNQTSSKAFQMDPRMEAYVYGSGANDPNSYLGALHRKYMANPSGINPMMQQGLDIAKANLTDPAYSQTFQNMRDSGNRLLTGPMAGNPFTAQQMPPGGPTGASAGPSFQMPVGAPAFQGAGAADSLIQRGQGLLTVPGAPAVNQPGGGLLGNYKPTGPAVKFPRIPSGLLTA